MKETLLDHGPGMYIKPYDETSSDKHGSGRFFRTESGDWTFTEDDEYLPAPVELDAVDGVDNVGLLSNGVLEETSRKNSNLLPIFKLVISFLWFL